MSLSLSICIPTLNRAAFIGETLESIVPQMEPGVEVVIVDGGSTDDTAAVIGQYQEKFPFIRYLKSKITGAVPSNQGFDRDCNYAVESAAGEYCWLMTDDDLLKPGAIKRVLQEVAAGPELIIVDAEVRSMDFSRMIVPWRLGQRADKVYDPADWNDFASAVGPHLTFLGAVIIRKSLWESRSREKYFGTGFVHVGVIFDNLIPGRISVIADPLVSIRYGNALWASRAFEIWMFNWPNLIWSFGSLSEEARETLSRKEPWRDIKSLFIYRATGAYSLAIYRKHLAGRLKGVAAITAYAVGMVPAALANVICALYFGRVKKVPGTLVEDLLSSRPASWISRSLVRKQAPT